LGTGGQGFDVPAPAWVLFLPLYFLTFSLLILHMHSFSQWISIQSYPPSSCLIVWWAYSISRWYQCPCEFQPLSQMLIAVSLLEQLHVVLWSGSWDQYLCLTHLGIYLLEPALL
jgi:hypothetical protein